MISRFNIYTSRSRYDYLYRCHLLSSQYCVCVIQKVCTLNFMDFGLSPLCTLLYVFEVPPLSGRTRAFNCSTPIEHLNILFISESSKFATFDIYLIPRKITTYLCSYDWECDFACIMFKRQFHLLRMLCKYLPYKNYMSVHTFFEESPPPCTFSYAFLGTPSPLQNVRTFCLARREIWLCYI